MCGRFTLRTSPRAVAEAFQLSLIPDFGSRYNIAPTQSVQVVRASAETGQLELLPLHWGLVPRWAEDPRIGSRMINARAESVADKPAFRDAFRKRRCLIVADGFYEWQKQGAEKQPYLIEFPDQRPFAFAGLWERWKREEFCLESCTIVTTEANETLRPLHDRMPVILSPDDYARWLDPQRDSGQLQALLRPCPHDWLIMRPVSTKVNSAANESPECAEPAAGQQRLPGL